MPARRFTDSEEQQIAHIYSMKYHSARAISEIFDCSPNTILNALHRQGINTGKLKVRKNLYHFDYHSFDTLDSEYPVYWLGFIYADGHVREKPPTLIVQLSEKDISHIRALAQFLDSEYPIHTRENSAGNKISALRVTHWHIAQRLIELGIIARRSNIVRTTQHIPHNLLHHFIRGLFDGDGCAVTARPELTFAGKFDTVLWVRGMFNHFVETSPHQALVKNTCSDTTYSIWYGGIHQVHRLANFMYRNATIWLERKRDIIEAY